MQVSRGYADTCDIVTIRGLSQKFVDNADNRLSYTN